MIWFFERAGERLQCEIRAAAERGGFELLWEGPDGQVHIEHSDNPATLTTLRKQLEATLLKEGWKRTGRVTPDKRFL